MYIISTLSNDQRYILEDGNYVLINGKANITNKNLITPLGMVTNVDDDLIPLLEKNRVFQIHKENGFITVQRSKIKDSEADEVAKDMEARDESAPLTAADIEKKSKAKKKD